jgi:hypothetical protein
MHHITPVDHLSDCELLAATERAATNERHLTAELLALLGEVDARRLYLGQSCASLFTYCTQALHFSEHAAYHRIEAARAARQFPVILNMVAEGALTLTTVTLLRPHLTMQNHAALLDAARHKSKREVEHQIACLAPQPDERTVVRKLATVVQLASPALATEPAPLTSDPAAPAVTSLLELPPRIRATLASGRYLLKVTLARRPTRNSPRSGSDTSHDPERRPSGRHRSSIDAFGRRTGADQGREDRALGMGIAIEPALIVTVSLIGPPHSRIDPPRRVGTRRGTLRVRWRARPMHRSRPSRIPSRHSVRRWWPDKHRESRAALPRAQRA